MNSSDEHEKPGFFCTSALPGELQQPLVQDRTAPAVTTAERITQAYSTRLESFDQEADDPRLQRHSRR